ncbi:transcriptional regulator family: Fungal Specific TF [Penicillium roqueforti]|uniref:transcriptional regulator family: Fungal Specific TF n=1 Tax=Penicillium roqueforti TaxID=5082 RepID=UPI00190C3A13|nr:transcriptional regulator family: Fungal Specific TF [Penicillium roqueforti]KAF9248694.1 transcriptional regulator family: Fungal Specific TF [Penicillium roqueforti]KAI1838231.1 transcriptional regulator family: Fungal Specific TF [Penicillium roqueforti]KAI2719099.1 transcriptional regulator family: Fungal Specific TF [Penicillium roqueforti]KAI2760649.1 transcriptional regulator family: Fungal Specific TF [Penicillium roqueforti]KAI3079051.1 transcriptional regulator family: Fungal Spec
MAARRWSTLLYRVLLTLSPIKQTEEATGAFSNAEDVDRLNGSQVDLDAFGQFIASGRKPISQPHMTLTNHVPQTYPLDSYLTTINELLSPPTPDLILGEYNQPFELQRTFETRLPNLSEESKSYLHLKGALRIVPVDLRNELLGAYIKYVHPLLPVIDLQWFLSSVMVEDESRFPSPLLHQAVMLAGSAFIEQEAAVKAGFSSRKALRRTLFGRAKLLYEFETEPDAYTQIQALLLMMQWHGSGVGHKIPTYWFDLAYSTAERVGLLGSLETGSFSHKHRLWWCLYVRDRILSLGFRRPLRIPNSDVTMSLLESTRYYSSEPYHDLVLVMLGEAAAMLNWENQERMMLLFIQEIKLAHCVGVIINLLYQDAWSPSPSGDYKYAMVPKSNVPQAAITECEQLLKTWIEDLPAPAHYFSPSLLHGCHTESPEIVLLVHQAFLYLLHLTTICLSQKLKCDGAHPCVLCTRAGDKCETSQRRVRRTRGQNPRGRRRHMNSGVHRAIAPAPPKDSNSIHGAGVAEIASAPESSTSCPERLSKELPPGANASYPERSPEELQSGANGFAIDFARQVFNEEEAGRTLTGASIPIPDDTEAPTLDNSLWHHPTEVELPPEAVILALVDVYFDRMQWFILLLHEPSFRQTARRITSQTVWRRQDLSTTMLVLAVAMIGLHSVLPDDRWPGHELLREYSVDGEKLMHYLNNEIQRNLLDISIDCRIEAVQVCLLVSSYYIYHRSPSLAWTVSGMGVRSANALHLYTKSVQYESPVVDEIRSRCWNHAISSDTFASVVYGRPCSIDTELVALHSPREMDDLAIDPLLLENEWIFGDGMPKTTAGFFAMKYEIYNIIRDILSRFRRLQLRKETIEEDLLAIVEAAQDSEEQLVSWRKRVPRLFDFEFWSCDNRLEQFQRQIEMLPQRTKYQAETIILQAAILQLTYDGALIQAHRPLLEQKITSSCSRLVVDAIHESFRVATAAALRISHIPVLRFKHHFAESFASLQQFTAGVILCILPTCQPFTSAAHEAKAGIIRIIHASSAFGPRNRIAKQTVQLLTELLKVTVDREMSSALRRGVETIIPRRISERGSILNAQPRIDHTRSDSLSSRDTSLDQSSTSTSHALPQAIHDHSRVNDRIAQAPVKPPEYPSANIFEQLDDTFAAFGERMFNLISDDQSSAWNWGRTVP